MKIKHIKDTLIVIFFNSSWLRQGTSKKILRCLNEKKIKKL